MCQLTYFYNTYILSREITTTITITASSTVEDLDLNKYKLSTYTIQ